MTRARGTPRTGRRWWIVYALCVALLLSAMAGVSLLVLRIERQATLAGAEADRQAVLRLALWRMDSWLSPRLGREAARPYFEYLAFYSNDTAYTRYLSEIPPGDVLTPSPLLSFESDYILLHFQIAPDGGVTSPQVPTGNELDLWQSKNDSDALLAKSGLLERVRGLVQANDVFIACRVQESFVTSAAPPIPPAPPGAPGAQTGAYWSLPPQQRGQQQVQQALNQAEFQKRSEASQRARQLEEPSQVGLSNLQWLDQQRGSINASTDDAISIGPLVAVWAQRAATTGEALPGSVEPELLFMRRVTVNGTDLFQGFLADWPRIRAALIEEASDLVPGIGLTPVLEPSHDSATGVRGAAESASTPWMLASIPAVVEAPPAPSVSSPLLSPARGTLALAWAAVLLAALAAGLTLRSVIDFGARRSRFASAVTHELRTPLTTFRMYSEMLAEGMVNDPARQAEYHRTLRDESARLAGLVENVLAYAQVEDGRADRRLETLTLHSLIERHRSALERRALECGATLMVSIEGSSDSTSEARTFATDADAIGQILVNLVDNACKYGLTADAAAIITLTARLESQRLVISVRDHGRGVHPGMARRIFEPFDRGAIEPGAPTPGVGLGLALSRELAHALGGRLTLEPTPDGGRGALFRLTVPVVG